MVYVLVLPARVLFSAVEGFYLFVKSLTSILVQTEFETFLRSSLWQSNPDCRHDAQRAQLRKKELEVDRLQDQLGKVVKLKRRAAALMQ